MKQKVTINSFINFFSGLKFAVLIISFFTIAMIIGTFQESYHGTEYANRLIYKSLPFMFIQLGFYVCVFLAALMRMPPKKRLYGFYVIHAGIIIILGGSFVTYYAGIDGNLTLTQNDPSRTVVINEDILKITNLTTKAVEVVELPFKAGIQKLELPLLDPKHHLVLESFLPSAEMQLSWVPPRGIYPKFRHFHSSQYLLKNQFTSQEMTFTLHPEANEFESTTQLGPLGVHYLPWSLFECFRRPSKSGLILWNQNTSSCQTLEQTRAKIQTTRTKKRFFSIPYNGKNWVYFPDLSPWPITDPQKKENLNFNRQAAIRIFSKAIFQNRPHLFLFGRGGSWYDRDLDSWQTQSFDKGEKLTLPWMAAEVTLIEHHQQKIPVLTPHYVIPMQDNNKIIVGNNKALKLSLNGNTHWVKDSRSTTLLIGPTYYRFELTKKSLRLPFEFTLSRFKMAKNPGTNDPASYESFVKLFTNEGTSDHHIFMNNPLKHDGFTFYQASYFKDRFERYGTVLSVNYDPGRFWKYLGSLFLVLGSAWHFYLRKKVAH